MLRPFPAYSGSAEYFFVCYTHADDAAVFGEMRWLRDAGFNLWYDEGIDVGSVWRRALADSLTRAAGVIYFCTERSTRSEFCLKELNFALDHGVPILVANLDGTPLPSELQLSLGDRQHLDLRHHEPAAFRAHLSKALERVLAGDPDTPSDAAADVTGKSVSKSAAGPVLAVLPFENLSPIADNAWFARGIHEDVLTYLSRLPELKVISRTSVMQFESSQSAIPEIARRLGATHILEGSVRREGNRVRITVQLIDGATDVHVWSEHYDRELTDIFAIQSEVAGTLCATLDVTLRDGARQPAPADPTRDLSAYDLYMRGRALLDAPTAASVSEALELFSQATERDPDFALAHAGHALGLRQATEFGRSWAEVRDEMRERGERAIALGPDQSESHYALARYYHEEQDPRAEAHFRRAIELEPSNSEYYDWFGGFLLRERRLDEAIEQFRTQITIDPMSQRANIAMANVLKWRGEEDEALAYLRRAVLIDPERPGVHEDVAGAYGGIDDYRALEHAYRGWCLSGSARAASVVALRLIFLGDYVAGQKWVDVMAAVEPSFYSVITAQAYIHTLCGNLDGLDALVTQWQQLAPSHPAFMRIRADLELWRAFARTDTGARAAGLQRARDGYRRALGTDLDDPITFQQDNIFALTAYGSACDLLGDASEAARVHDAILEQFERVEPLSDRRAIVEGIIHGYRGDARRSAENFRRARQTFNNIIGYVEAALPKALFPHLYADPDFAETYATWQAANEAVLLRAREDLPEIFDPPAITSD